MKLHLPKLLLTAVMAAITLGSGLAKADIYTLTGLKNTDTEMAHASYTLTNYDEETQTYTLTDTVLSDAWGGGEGATAQMVEGKHTLRFAADQTISNHALKYTFKNWAIGGLIVESGATGYFITSEGADRPFKIYDGTYNIGEDFTINTSSGTDGDKERITLFGTQTWNIAAGKTMSFNSGATPVRIADDAYVSITGSGTMSFAPGLEVLGTLDLTAISLPDDGTNTDDVKVMNLMNSASGSGTIKLNAGSVIQTTSTKTAVTLNTNYVVEGDASAKLVLTSHHDNNAWRTWTIGESGSIIVGSGLGTLEFLAGQKAIINGGSITVGTLALGHTSPSTDSASYSGALEMRGSGSTLTVGKIKVQNPNTDYANRKNEVVITGGTLKVTGQTAIEYTADAQTTVLIGGTGSDSVILQTGSNNWVLSKGAASGSSLEIGNITIDAANEKMITITDAYLNGVITNNATNDEAGLTLSGNFTTGSGFCTQSYTGTKETGFAAKFILTGLGTSEKTILSSGITFDGVGIGDSGWTLGDDGYYYRATETSNLFHVYGTTNIDDNIYQAGTNFIGFEVHSGGTLNIAGHEVQGLKVYLNENATLANNGTAIGETTRQYDQVILKGNAYADTAANFGLLARSYDTTTLDLAGYTLTKKGTAEFVLVNTTVEAGTIDVQQGGLKLVGKEGKSITLKDGVNIKVASGAFVNLATDDLTSDQILAITGAGEVRINSTITLGEGTAALSGTFVTNSGSLTINGTTIGALRTNNNGESTVANGSVTNLTSAGGTTNVTGGSVTTLSATGGTTNVSGGFIEKIGATGGTTNIVGTINIGTAGKTGRDTGIYAHTGTVNIGNDAGATTLVTATRLETGDTDSANLPGGIVNIKSNATLVITSAADDTGDSGKYKDHGLMVGAWNSDTEMNISGALLAENVRMVAGDKKGVINLQDGAVLAVKGLTSGVSQKSSIELNLNTGSKLILGESGIESGLKSLDGAFADGTVGISHDTVTIAKNIALSSTRGTTFDTQKYVWGEGGASIAQGTEGGTLSISGVISDHSVTTTEGEGDSATTTTTNYPGKLVKAGAGTLELSGANTYTGGTDINAGTVKTGNASALGEGAVSVAKDASLELGTSLTVSDLTIDEGGSLIFGNGTRLTVTGTLTLANANDIKLAEGFTFDSADEVKLATGTLALGEGFDATTWAGAGTCIIGGVEYTSSLKAEGDAISVTFKQMVEAPGEPISVTGWDLDGNALTLNVDAVLSEGMEVSVHLLDDTMMKDILTELGEGNYTDGKPMVTITLQGTSGTITANELNEVVFVKGDTGLNYWGEMVGNQLMYNVERIPEPTTATLSLLALMGLAARRRRK